MQQSNSKSTDLTHDPGGRPLALPEFGTVEALKPAEVFSGATRAEEAEQAQRPGGIGTAVVASATAAPRCASTTGPYRRIVSQPGFAYMSARIFLPGGDDVVEVEGNKDTAYVYGGGWGGGADGASGKGDALDAGFQHSPTFDDWALFIIAEHVGGESATPRFLPNQEVFLEVFISAEDEITARATGELVTGSPGTVSIVLTLQAGSGWNLGGQGVLLKRTTSIAQDPHNLETGSLLRGVRWRDCRIGQSAQSNAPWLAAQTAARCTFLPMVVSVAFVDSSEETNTITL